MIAAKIDWDIRPMLGVKLCPAYLLTHLILVTTLGDKHCNYAFYTDQETKANKEMCFA